MGAAYSWDKNRLSADGFFGNGLRKDFANTGRLPSYFQLNEVFMPNLVRR